MLSEVIAMLSEVTNKLFKVKNPCYPRCSFLLSEVRRPGCSPRQHWVCGVSSLYVYLLTRLQIYADAVACQDSVLKVLLS
jgi:hypothetical protein